MVDSDAGEGRVLQGDAWVSSPALGRLRADTVSGEQSTSAAGLDRPITPPEPPAAPGAEAAGVSPPPGGAADAPADRCLDAVAASAGRSPDEPLEEPPARATGRLLPSVAALLALFLGGLIYLALRWSSEVHAADGRQQLVASAAAAARQQAVNFISFDYRDVAAYSRVTAANSVGQFHQQDVTAATNLEVAAVGAKAVSKANVLSVAVITATPTQAAVLVIVDDQVTNKTNPKGTINHYRLKLLLQRHAGEWLVAGLVPIN